LRKVFYSAALISFFGLLIIAIVRSEMVTKIIFKSDNAALIASGKVTYLQNCASCHGDNLQGQDDWQSPLASGRLPAPPHDADGHTWHHPDGMLFTITKFGPAAIIGDDYESDMPAFNGILTDDEIRAVLAYIKSTWPKRSLDYQQKMTQAENKENQ
jgi:mono/diheme cytochrome c family protein